jgi:hypothetical protein
MPFKYYKKNRIINNLFRVKCLKTRESSKELLYEQYNVRII